MPKTKHKQNGENFGNFFDDTNSDINDRHFQDLPLIQHLVSVRNSNTALKSQSHAPGPLQAQIDWLSLSFFNQKVEDLYYKLRLLFDIEVYWDTARGSRYDSGGWLHYSGGSGVLFSVKSSTGFLHDVRLSMPGEACSAISSDDMYKNLGILYKENQARCTRIDLKVDDYSRQVDRCLLLEDFINETICGCSQSKYTASFGSSGSGETFNFGNRRSDKYGRFYDRASVTNGLENCDRFEVEFKRTAAAAIFIQYVEADYFGSCGVLNSYLRNAFYFAIRKDKNLSRACRRKYWDDFMARIASDYIIPKKPQKHSSMERRIAWVRRCVSKTLLTIEMSLGRKDFKKLKQKLNAEAKAKLKDIDFHLVSTAKADGMNLKSLYSII